jgi:tripartite-type tricarboxylate transporter receptor subunit TctC
MKTACILAILLATAAPAHADAVADFYKDRTVTVVCAGEVGGAHGAYAQLMATHIRKYIPGNPNVIIQYMVGAGGNQAMNYLASVAPKDGTYLGVPLQDIIFNARVGMTSVKYDAAKFNFLGGADTTRTTVSVMKSTGVATLDDAKQKEILIGANGPSGQNYTIPLALNGMLGTKFKIVSGYGGINLIHLAMDRGEVQGTAASWAVIATMKREWIDKKLINNLVTIGTERDPDLPDVPALAELLTSAEDRALIPLLAGPAAHGRGWVTFGDVPRDRLAALRDAYAKALADPAYVADAKARGFILEPVSAQHQQDVAEQILATPEAPVARLKRFIGMP